MSATDLTVPMDHDDDSDVIAIDEKERISPTASAKSKRTRLTFPFGACRVCTDSATGIHYGIATCEGCKGFFKRSILRKEKYRCYFDNTCLVNVTNRNRCKACRFRRCIDEGMSVDGVKMGRIPKLVKERALRELKEQQMKQEAISAQTNDVNGRESSCSSLSDRSVENYDPNPMETDYVKSQVSPIQSNGGVIGNFSQENSEKKISDNCHIDEERGRNSTKSSLIKRGPISNSKTLPEEEGQRSHSIIHRTKYPTFLPDDFTLDETEGISELRIGLLSSDKFEYIRTIAHKLADAQLNSAVQLNDDEMAFIRFLRCSSSEVYHRHSRRSKQLVSRMYQMIEQNINEYPGDNATLTQFFASIRSVCEVYTRTMVVNVLELPGMKNIKSNDLQKLLLRRSFESMLLKYHQLFHSNGEAYLLTPDGLQLTRMWMDRLCGGELSNMVFEFSRQFRDLHLTEDEIALVFPLHMCYYDQTMEDAQIPKMLRSCYLYALHVELCHHYGESKGRQMCSQILRVLDLLDPLNDLYQAEAASRMFEV